MSIANIKSATLSERAQARGTHAEGVGRATRCTPSTAFIMIERVKTQMQRPRQPRLPRAQFPDPGMFSV